MDRATALRSLPPPATAPGDARGDGETGSGVGDLLILALLLAVSVVPLAGSLAGGSWDERTVGVATAISLLVGRELFRELRARRWAD